MRLQVDELTAELEAARARLAGAPQLEDRAFAAERARVEVRVPRYATRRPCIAHFA